MKTKAKVALCAVTAFVAVDALAIITGNGNRFGATVFMLAIFAIYWAPAFIAMQRRINNVGAVAIVNLFLGWTFIGWVVALAMAMGGSARPATPPLALTKVCPDCAETVLADAKVCRYCRHQFAEASR